MSIRRGEQLRKCWIANAERLDRQGHFANYSKKQHADVLRKGYLGLWAPDRGIDVARREADLGYAIWTQNYIDDMRDFMVVGREAREKTLALLDEVPPESYEPPYGLEDPPGCPFIFDSSLLRARFTSSSRLKVPRSVLGSCFGRVIVRFLDGSSYEML